MRIRLPRDAMMGRTALQHAFLDEAGGGQGTLVTLAFRRASMMRSVFYERYLERFGLEPECYAASAYDATGVILEAIERVGRADRSAITRAAFATRDFEGVLGRWSFDANGDIDLRRGTRLTIRNGSFEPLTVLSIDG
jgi:branched-chain amino acid transport system substrate-binding protein